MLLLSVSINKQRKVESFPSGASLNIHAESNLTTPCTSEHLICRISINDFGRKTKHARLVRELLINSLAERLVWSHCSQRSSLMRIQNIEAVHIAGIDPTESKSQVRIRIRIEVREKSYPVLLDPWLPYSASTR